MKAILKSTADKLQLTCVILCAQILLMTSTVTANTDSVQLTPELVQHLTELSPIRGGVLTSTDLNEKVILVTFFASWCPPCRKEFKHLNTLRADYPESELEIIAINVFEQFLNDDKPALEKFLEFTAPTFSVIEGSDQTRALFGQVERIPTLFVFNAQGEPITHFIHKRGATKQTAGVAELRDAIDRAR